MSGPIQTPPVGPAQSAAQQSQAAQNATLVRLPPGQATLQSGQSLTGTILGNPANGQVTVQLPAGQLLLQSPLNLPPGTPVTVQVQSGGANPQLLIHAQSPTPTQSAPQAAPTAPPSASGATPVNVSGIIAPGAQLTGHVSASTEAATTSTNTATARSAATAGSASQTAATTGSSAATPLPLPTGTTVSLQLVSITPPGSTSTIPTAGNPALHGIVTGATVDGRPVFQSQSGVLTLETRSPIPVGTRLSLELIGAPRHAAGADLQSSSLHGQWQALRDALQFVQTANPTATQSLVQNIPQPGAQLTASLLFFLSAITSGDVRRLLGEEASRALERNGDLFRRLQEDAGQLQRLATDRPGQEWRSFMIPLLTHTGLEQIKLFVRDEKDDEDEEDPEDSTTRFIIEVLLKRLGQVQFDGRARKKNIDLVMNSQHPVPDDMRNRINEIYIDTLSALGFAGTLAYRETKEFETAPLADAGLSAKGITV
ncbi:MAG TPA: hypothetical protein DCE33_08590 [Rhodospirillaceae bacterium]|nr:hypothetical protein [Rhodospirillaceae bacterium]